MLWAVGVTVIYLVSVFLVNLPARGIDGSAILTDEQEWQEYHREAAAEYAAEFTTLFESYETRWSRNGRLMIRQGSSGPYRFVAKAK